mgnify:CR=1 FL=1
MAAPRFASLDQLGKGAWRVSESTPFKPAAAGGRSARGGMGKRIDNAVLHDLLWQEACREFGQALKLVREFKGVVEGRRFSVDIAIPEARVAIEIDGWEWHGKHKGDFIRDRERQNLITAERWQFLRFTAGMIRNDMPGCLELVRRTLGGALPVSRIRHTSQ